MPRHSFPTAQPIDLVINNRYGDITVHASDSDTTIVSTVGRHADDLEVVQQGNLITAAARSLSVAEQAFERRRRIDIAVEAPVGSNLKLDCGAGTITVTGPFNQVEARLGAGRITLSQVLGEIRVRDSSGNIRIDEVAAIARLTTSAGTITVGRVLAETELKVGSGSVDLDEVAAPTHISLNNGSLNVHLVTGELTVDAGVGHAAIDRISAGSLTYRGASGTVRVGVVAGVPVWTDLRTTAGRVHNGLPPVGEPQPGQDHISLRIATQSGAIDLIPA